MAGVRKLASLFRPLFNRVLVRRRAVETKTASGILIPESSQKQTNEGTIVAVGPGLRTPEGKILPIDLKVGDSVMLPEYGGKQLELDDEEYLLFSDTDILGVIAEK